MLHRRALGAEDDGAVSYGRFRNFLVLLPPERLAGMDAETAWFESATIIPLGAFRRHCPLSPILPASALVQELPACPHDALQIA